MYKSLKLSRNNYEYKISDILISGVLIGLMALSGSGHFYYF